MSQEQAWTLEEMSRALRAERLAEAEHARLVRSVSGAGPSPRSVLARLLRALAAVLDDQPAARADTQVHPDGRLVRAV